MPGKAAKVRASEKQLDLLQEMSRSRTLSMGTIQRATILVLGFQGLLNSQIAERVGLNRQQVGIWRQRWREAWELLCVWECTEPHRLHEGILEVLADAPRPGSPGTFTAEQVAQIIAVACESPKLSGRPINRWTHRELRDEVVVRKIVTTISKAQVGPPCKNILSSFGEGDSKVRRGATRQLVSHSRGPKSAVKSSRWWSRTIRSGLLAALNAP